MESDDDDETKMDENGNGELTETENVIFT